MGQFGGPDGICCDTVYVEIFKGIIKFCEFRIFESLYMKRNLYG